MIKWYRRRKYRKFMRDIFRLARGFILDSSEENCKEIIDALEELVDDYDNKYGVDDISLHYRGRLDYFRFIGGWKVR